MFDALVPRPSWPQLWKGHHSGGIGALFHPNHLCCKPIVPKPSRKIENVIFAKFYFINILVLGRDENKDVCITLAFCALTSSTHTDTPKKKEEAKRTTFMGKFHF